MGRAPQRTPNNGPTGFQRPSQSTQEPAHGWAALDPNAKDGNDPFSAVDNPPESSDGYSATLKGDLGGASETGA